MTRLLLLLLLLLPSLVLADYRVIYRDSDKKVRYAAPVGSDFNVPTGHTLSPAISGDSPVWATVSGEYDTGSDTLIDRGKWFYLDVTTSDETITADGTSKANINIQKRKWDDSAMTDAGDNNAIVVTSTRGLLSATSGNLVNGTFNVSLTSVAENVTSTVMSYDTDAMLDTGTVDVGFVP